MQPFVEMDEVAGIEADAEEGIADVAHGGVKHFAARHADAQRLVPGDGGREVWRDQFLDIVADARVAVHPPMPTMKPARQLSAPMRPWPTTIGSPRSMIRRLDWAGHTSRAGPNTC